MTSFQNSGKKAVPPILVLGVGNLLLGDDGVGVRVVQKLDRWLRAESHDCRLRGWVEFLDGGTAGLDLLDAMAHRPHLLVVDAVTADEPPGTLLKLEPRDLLAGNPGRVFAHDFGVLETLFMARQMGLEPAAVSLMGVVVHAVDYGMELSPEIEACLPLACDAVRAEVESAIVGMGLWTRSAVRDPGGVEHVRRRARFEGVLY